MTRFYRNFVQKGKITLRRK